MICNTKDFKRQSVILKQDPILHLPCPVYNLLSQKQCMIYELKFKNTWQGIAAKQKISI